MIARADIIAALVDLFEGWMKPTIQFSTGPLSAEEIQGYAHQFYALNCYTFDKVKLTPDELIRLWSERKTRV